MSAVLRCPPSENEISPLSGLKRSDGKYPHGVADEHHLGSEKSFSEVVSVSDVNMLASRSHQQLFSFLDGEEIFIHSTEHSIDSVKFVTIFFSCFFLVEVIMYNIHFPLSLDLEEVSTDQLFPSPAP